MKNYGKYYNTMRYWITFIIMLYAGFYMYYI